MVVPRGVVVGVVELDEREPVVELCVEVPRPVVVDVLVLDEREPVFELCVEVPRPVVVVVALDEREPVLVVCVEVPRGAEALRSVRMVFGSAVLPVVRRVLAVDEVARWLGVPTVVVGLLPRVLPR